MGASASVSISGVTAASDTDWAWWKAGKAAAGVYTFSGSAVADAVAAPPPTSAGPSPKFGPLTTAIVWPPLNLSTTGPKGSTATASMVGSSNVGIVFYGTKIAVSAATSAAAGGSATAAASATDPWQVTFRHRPGHKSYVLIALTPDFSLEPARGSSGMHLFGSFGAIRLSLNGLDNKAKADVKLEAGWRVYEHVQLPTVGTSFRAPRRVLTKQKLERVFLRQRDPKATLWLWKGPAPLLTFVKEVPHSVAMETVEAGVGVDDADAGDEGATQTRRKRAKG